MQKLGPHHIEDAGCRRGETERGFEISGQTEFEGHPVYGMIRQPQV